LEIPEKQSAVQLTAPDELCLNNDKPVDLPGPYQILCKVEATGLCFSDLKVLKQFDKHARKAEVISGIDPEVLKEVPSYVPGTEATVAGHETVVRVCAVGEKVDGIKVGGRYLVETDYRWLPTAEGKSSFGYNFEGGLQEYVLMDKRVITSPEGEVFLLSASEELSASAVGLVEPWACVENAYASGERTCLKDGGRMLVAADVAIDSKLFYAFLARFGRPAEITWVSDTAFQGVGGICVVNVDDVSKVDDGYYDDVVYFGSDAATVESLFPKIAAGGLFNIVQCGGRFNADVLTCVGRIHYGCIRIIGTGDSDPALSMETIPASGEIRRGDRIAVIGAGGPMGVMHVIRNICSGIKGISVLGADIDDGRLENLKKLAVPIAEKNGVSFEICEKAFEKADECYDYVSLMAPVPSLAVEAVKHTAKNGIINIFAGIAADISARIDLDAYIEKQLYFIGTSGSVLADMKNVLAKVESGSLDTNISVAAVCGLDGAVDGIKALEERLVPGKIMVYPACKDLPLTTLDQLAGKFPEVAGKLCNGVWTKTAEDTLLKALSK